jgi:hypothetical protein
VPVAPALCCFLRRNILTPRELAAADVVAEWDDIDKSKTNATPTEYIIITELNPEI